MWHRNAKYCQGGYPWTICLYSFWWCVPAWDILGRACASAEGISDGRLMFPLSWQKDDDIEEGDLPEHKRPSAPIDFTKLDPGKPESILKMTKKGKTLMMFVTVSGNPTEKETEEITSLWQGSLFNANYDVQR